MLAASIPYKFAEPWAAEATTGYVTNAIPVTASGAVASQALGFPPLTATPEAAGGTPPSIADINGALKYVSEWAQWQQAGGPVTYDFAFSTQIGGYPKGSILTSTSGSVGSYWISQVDNNSSDPDTGGANWLGVSFSGGVTSFNTRTGAVTLSSSDVTTALGFTPASVPALNAEAATRASADTTLQGEIPSLTGPTDVTSSRSLGVNYTNTNTHPLFVSVEAISTGANANLVLFVSGIKVAQFGYPINGQLGFVCGMVPPGAVYQATNTVAGVALQGWIET